MAPDTPPESFRGLKTRDTRDLPLDTGRRGQALCPPPPERQDPGFLQTTPREDAATLHILPPRTWRNTIPTLSLTARVRTVQDPRKTGLPHRDHLSTNDLRLLPPMACFLRLVFSHVLHAKILSSPAPPCSASHCNLGSACSKAGVLNSF